MDRPLLYHVYLLDPDSEQDDKTDASWKPEPSDGGENEVKPKRKRKRYIPLEWRSAQCCVCKEHYYDTKKVRHFSQLQDRSRSLPFLGVTPY